MRGGPGPRAPKCLLLLVLALLPLSCGRESLAKRVLKRLAAESTTRATLLRPSGAFPYRAYGVPQERSTQNPSIRRVQSRTEGTRGGGAAEIENSLGILELKEEARYDLFYGDLDRAIERLDEVLQLSGNDSEALNDSAVAYWERGIRFDRPLDLLTALERIQKAYSLAARTVEVEFNRALILQRLGMRLTASLAWKAFLTREPRGGWAREARSHLRQATDESFRRDWQAHRLALERGDPLPNEQLQKLISNYPRQLFEITEERLLAQLASQLVTRQDEGVRDAKMRLERIGRALADQRGEWMVLDALERLNNAQNRSGLVRLAEAHQRFAEGMRLYRAAGCAQAETALRSAELGFSEANSPLALDARFYRAVCGYFGLADKGRHLFQGILAEPKIERYPNLRGRAYWMLGTANLVSGRIEAAISDANQMREAWKRAVGDDQAAMADTQLAAAYDARGQIERGWRHRLHGLINLLPRDTPRRRHSLLHEAAQALARHGRFDAALAFLDEVLTNAKFWKDPLAAAEGYTLRARARVATGDTPGALADAARALGSASRMPSGDLRTRTTGAALLSRGLVEIAIKPRAALDSLERGYWEERVTGWEFERFFYLSWSAQAHLRLGDIAEARKLLLTSVNEYEALRGEAVDPSARIEIFQVAQRAFDALLKLTPPKDPEAALLALSYSERSRARTFLDAWQPRDSGLGRARNSSMDAATLVRLLPADLSLVEFAVLPDRTLFWIVEKGRLRAGTIPISALDLERSVVAFRRALKNRRTRSIQRLADELFQQLIRPLGLSAQSDQTLGVVPDGPLERLPFSSLWDRERKTYLVESQPLTVLPSASLALLLARQRTRDSSAQDARAETLIVGAPDLSGTDYSHLESLPAALSEASGLAALYPRHLLLLGRAATRSRFLSELPRHSIVHFAGHSVSIGPGEANVLLLLSPDSPGIDSSVSVATLRRLQLRSTKVVVLAACNALDGESQGREGALSVASAFLGAGVPSIVAPLWSVRDRESADLMRRLHRHLLAGLDTPAALRAAVLDLIHNRVRSSPASWAAYASLGL